MNERVICTCLAMAQAISQWKLQAVIWKLNKAHKAQQKSIQSAMKVHSKHIQTIIKGEAL